MLTSHTILLRWLESHNKSWFIQDVWSGLYSTGGSKELWAWTFIHTSWNLQYVSERDLFSRLLEGIISGHCIKNVWERSTAKNYHPFSLLSVVSKVFEKLVNSWIVDHQEKCGLFLISSMALGLFDQLQIFWKLYLMELQGLLIGLGLLKLCGIVIKVLDSQCIGPVFKTTGLLWGGHNLSSFLGW